MTIENKVNKSSEMQNSEIAITEPKLSLTDKALMVGTVGGYVAFAGMFINNIIPNISQIDEKYMYSNLAASILCSTSLFIKSFYIENQIKGENK